MSEQPGRYQRSTAGMVGAMVVLVGVVLAFVLLRDVNRVQPTNPAPAIDYAAVAAAARPQASFRVLAPRELPRGWRATSAQYTPGRNDTWHLGLLTAQGRYVGVEQAHETVSSMVETYVDPAAARGAPVTVGGSRWSTYSDAGGDYALVRSVKGVTTLVLGHDVPPAELASFVASLR